MGSRATRRARATCCGVVTLFAMAGAAMTPAVTTAAAQAAATGITTAPVVPATAAQTAATGASTAAPAADANTVAPSQSFDQLMTLLAQRQHGHVSFTEKHFVTVLDRPVESSGELIYDAPDRLEKRTLKPRPQTVVLRNGVITAQRGRHTYTLNLSDYPQIVPLIDSIRATLAGDHAALERLFKVSFDGSLDQWTLALAPSDPAVAKSVRSIRIEGARDAIHTVEIQQADGDRSLLTIGSEIAQ